MTESNHYGPIVYTIYTPLSPEGGRVSCRDQRRDVYVVRHQLGRRIVLGWRFTELVAIVATDVAWGRTLPTFEQSLALGRAAAICVRHALKDGLLAPLLEAPQSPES